LTISVNENSVTEAQATNYVRREFSYGKFNRSWSLPKNTNIEGISANYDAGILTVSIPEESSRSASRKIEID